MASSLSTIIAFAVLVGLSLVDAGGVDEPPANEHINIWVVAHTHDDTGWYGTGRHETVIYSTCSYMTRLINNCFAG